MSTDHNILIKVANTTTELLNNSHVQQQLAKCGVTEPIALLQVRNPDPQIYAVLQYSECIDNLIKAGTIPRDQYLSSEEYEELDPSNVSPVEFVEGATAGKDCTVL